jgi:hypothetical protein
MANNMDDQTNELAGWSLTSDADAAKRVDPNGRWDAERIDGLARELAESFVGGTDLHVATVEVALGVDADAWGASDETVLDLRDTILEVSEVVKAKWQGERQL